MTYSEVKAIRDTFLDIDSRRRGSEVLIEATTQAAIRDLKHYIPRFKDAVSTYAPGDLTMLTVSAVEAIAEYVKSRLARNVRNDIPLSREHMMEYKSLRRRVYVGSSEVEQKNYTLPQGETLILTIPLLVNGVAANVDLWKVWFTIKQNERLADRCAVAQLTLGDGIVVESLTSWRATLPSAATKNICAGDYVYEIEVQNPLDEAYVIETGQITIESEINRVA